MPIPLQCMDAVARRLITERLNIDDGGDSASRVITTALLMAVVIGSVATIGFQVEPCSEWLFLGMPSVYVPKTSSTLSRAKWMQMSCHCLLQVGAVNLVRLTGCAVELRQPAVSYLRIRALGLCASLVSMVCQAGLLAQRDSVAPLMSVLASASINLIVDVLLIVVWRAHLFPRQNTRLTVESACDLLDGAVMICAGPLHTAIRAGHPGCGLGDGGQPVHCRVGPSARSGAKQGMPAVPLFCFVMRALVM